MQSEVEKILSNLHVIGALSHNDKLMTNEDAFDIYAPTTLRGLMRTWYGERRGQNIARIRSTIHMAIEVSQRTLTDLCTCQPSNGVMDVNTLRRETIELQFRRMLDGLKRAHHGLTNLIQTYRDDAALSSQIVLINQEVIDFLEVMERHSPPAVPVPRSPSVLDAASCD
jgi:hypothetical protein